jgi:2'-5' RNA ligase
VSFDPSSKGPGVYNFFLDMQNPRYALVAYVKNPIGEFVENLRRELHPDLPHLAAHLTILPPRCLPGSESSALQMLERICSLTEPFEVSLGEVETFLPDTPTVYIRVTHAASRMCELHGCLNAEVLAFNEEWPYIPHLTIVKMATQLPAKNAFRVASERWSHYSETRRILLERLTFVREEEPDRWVDLAPVTLGSSLVSR